MSLFLEILTELVMGKNFLTIPIALLVLWLGGCQSSEPPQENSQATPQPTPQATPPAQPNFEKPMQPGTTTPKGKIQVSGLIPNTNPDTQAKTAIKGRNDPFAGFSVQPIIKVNPTESATNQTSQAPNFIPVPSNMPGTSAKAPGQPVSTTKAKPPQSSSRQTPLAKPVASNTNSQRTFPKLPSSSQSFPQPSPQPPQPVLAQGVAVTGVVELGGITQVIVKAPDEQFSRYVRVGDYLSNGQVKVKRIESSYSSTPIVVLEQYGIEVSKQVGEQPKQEPSEKDTTAAFVPDTGLPK